MSAIGFIMAGSGLEELYCTVYAKNRVPQMMNGKAYSRGIRALYFVEEALITVFLKTNHAFASFDKQELKDTYLAFKSGSKLAEDITQSVAVKRFVEILETQMKLLKTFLNFNYVLILRLFDEEGNKVINGFSFGS